MAILNWLFGRKKPDEARIEPTLTSEAPAPAAQPGNVLTDSTILPVVTPPPAMPQAALREIVFDCETTGFRARAGDRIVALSLIEVLDRRETGARLDLMVNPGRNIPADASAVHGITDADVRDAPSFASVAPQILAFIGGCPLVGYNLGFDLDFLSAELARAGIDPGTAIPDWSGCDLMAMAARRCGRTSLFKACAAFGVDLSSLTAHRAADDAFASARLLIALSTAATEPVSISLATYRAQECDAQCLYDDEDLQAGYDLFEAKDYAGALARVLVAVERSAARPKPDPDPWYVASQIFVRTKRYAEDRELLWRYFRLTIGPSVTITEIEALAASRFGYVAVAQDDAAEQDSVHSHFMMAERLLNAEKRIAVVKASPDEACAMTKTRLDDALKALPAEHAYQEAAKALRKMFAERINGDGNDLLEQLHGLAAEHAFLYGTMRLGWQHPANKYDHDCGLWVTIVEKLAKPEDRQRVREPYQVIGYQHLPLLIKTDVKRLVVAFGEPDTHEKPRERHADIWSGYRRAARAERDRIYGSPSS